MKPLKHIAMLGLMAMSLASCADIDPVIAEVQLPDSQPFIRNTNGYSYYRIPSMVITKHDNVLAFCEGRVNGREDTGDIDVVLRRSGDRGVTWQDLSVVFNDKTNTCRNPCPIYIPELNRVVLFMAKNYSDSRVYVTYSDNEGQTWSIPVEITDDVRPEGIKKYSPGPAHCIVKQHEPNKGRLIVSGNYLLPSDGKYYANAVYSDDNGATWKRGGSVPTPGTNEASVTELSDGRLMMNIRSAVDDVAVEDRYRLVSISTDGGITWSAATKEMQLPESGCQGSIFTYADGAGEGGKSILLFCNPAWQERRWHNTLRVSFDDGKTWSRGKDFTGEEVGGYTDIARFADGEIAVISEYGYQNEGGIIFRKYKLDELK